jgi:hypothetical protein
MVMKWENNCASLGSYVHINLVHHTLFGYKKFFHLLYAYSLLQSTNCMPIRYYKALMVSIDNYKLSFIATDGTSEAEFFCFDSVARRIVGKPRETLVAAAQISQGPPPDLAVVVSLKFTFAVTINTTTFS